MRALKILGSSIVVYLVVAACGAGFTELPGDLVDAALDALHPIPDAHAEGGDGGTICDCPPAPVRQTFEESCNDAVAGSRVWAKHEFAGKTRAQLLGVQAMTHAPAATNPDAAYVTGQPVIVGDGWVAVDCGALPTLVYDTVTFYATGL